MRAKRISVDIILKGPVRRLNMLVKVFLRQCFDWLHKLSTCHVVLGSAMLFSLFSHRMASASNSPPRVLIGSLNYFRRP